MRIKKNNRSRKCVAGTGAHAENIKNQLTKINYMLTFKFKQCYTVTVDPFYKQLLITYK